ncbi:transposase, partial [Candidatus Woesearchaeota archaeon]|nr:transposase [Candidatus Woesearchaeota archaeon]
MVPNVRRTWAPCGETPILYCAGHWTKISAISAITISAHGRRIQLYIRLHPNRNIRHQEVILFLRLLLRHLRKGFILLWDRSMVHRATRVKRFLKNHRRIIAYSFPPYAPELNPDEFIWTNLKCHAANSVPKHILHLRDLLKTPIRRLKSSKALLWSCIEASELPW